MPDRHAHMFSAVFQHAQQGMALIDLAGQFVSVNPALAETLGYTPVDLIGRPFSDITHDSDFQAVQQGIRDLIGGARREFQVCSRYAHHQGATVWMDVRITPVTDDTGAPICVVAQLRDVTQDRAQRARLKALEHRFDVAVNATQDGLWDWQADEGLTVTDRWTALMGCQGTAPTVRWWWRHVHPEDRALLRAQLLEHRSGRRESLDALHRVVTPDGQCRWLTLRGRIITRADDGTPTQVAGALTDMDDRMRTQQDLQVLLDHLPVMIGYWDADLHNRFGNRTYLDWFGKRAELLPGRHISEVLGPEIYQRNQPFIEKALRGEPQAFDRQLVSADGRVRDTHLQYIPDIHGQEVRGFYALGTDITAYRRSQQDLDEHRELARVTLESIGDGVITTDARGQVTFMNPVAQRLTGWLERDALGRNVETVLPLLDPAQSSVVTNPLRLALRDRVVVGLSSGTVLRSRRGHVAYIEDSAAPIFNRVGDLIGGVMVFHDVTEQQVLSQRMHHLARHDPLTGLANRSTLMEEVSATMERAAAAASRFALLFLDLDDFKHVNDVYGHAVGDQLLQEVSIRLQQELRGADLVARQGGDEFIILLPESVSAEELDTVGRRLLAALDRPFQLDDHSLSVSCSLGAALYPQDGSDAETLIRHADAAMYRAKQDGRNCLRFYDPVLEQQLHERQGLLQALKTAVREEQFELVFQPQVSARGGSLVGTEALLRWTLPDGTTVSPEVFVPLAEQSGLIVPLGSWVLRRACQQAVRWQRAGRPLRVAVNVSAVQFMEPTFVSSVRRILRASGLPASLLELEVTESALMHDVNHVRTVLLDLKALGISLAIDDFGTGYSSLSYLQAFPIDTLKIDRSFLPGAVGSGPESVLRAVVSLGQSLNMQLVAEGVESRAQQLALQALGCDVMQGFWFAPPMAPAAFDEWRSTWTPDAPSPDGG